MSCKHWSARPWWYKLFSGGSSFPEVQNSVRLMPENRTRDEVSSLHSTIEEWFNGEDSKGYYWCSTAYPETPAADNGAGTVGYHMDDLGWFYHFTDPDTAFAFKMRFG